MKTKDVRFHRTWEKLMETSQLDEKIISEKKLFS